MRCYCRLATRDWPMNLEKSFLKLVFLFDNQTREEYLILSNKNNPSPAGEKTMNLQTFFDIASPTTLVSLITDVENRLTCVNWDMLELKNTARECLIANVGEQEAKELLKNS